LIAKKPSRKKWYFKGKMTRAQIKNQINRLPMSVIQDFPKTYF
jgi:hypothetical protein